MIFLEEVLLFLAHRLGDLGDHLCHFGRGNLPGNVHLRHNSDAPPARVHDWDSADLVLLYQP